MRYIADGAQRCREDMHYAPAIALRTPEGAASEMEAVVSLSLRLQRASHHLVIAPSRRDWTILTREDDEPLVRDIVDAAGMNPDTALYAWARHEDHIHILLARFDPTTRRTAEDRFLVRDLERAALWISHERGLEITLGPNTRQLYADLTGQDISAVPLAPISHPEKWAKDDERSHLSSWQGRRFPGITAAIAKADKARAAGDNGWSAFNSALADEGLVLAYRTHNRRLQRVDGQLVEREMLNGLAVVEAVEEEAGPRRAKLKRFNTSLPRLEPKWGPYQPPSDSDREHARRRAHELRRDEPQRGRRMSHRQAKTAGEAEAADPIVQAARRLYEADKAARIAEAQRRHRDRVEILRSQREGDLARIAAVTQIFREVLLPHYPQTMRQDALVSLREVAAERRAEVMFLTRIPPPPRHPRMPDFHMVEQEYRQRALQEVAAERPADDPGIESAPARTVHIKRLGNLNVPVFNTSPYPTRYSPFAYLETAEATGKCRGAVTHSAFVLNRVADPSTKEHLGFVCGSLSTTALASAFDALKERQEPWARATRQTLAALSRADPSHATFSSTAIPQALAEWRILTARGQTELQRLMPTGFTATVWAEGRRIGDTGAWDTAMERLCASLPPLPAQPVADPEMDESAISASQETAQAEVDPLPPEPAKEDESFADAPPPIDATATVLPRDRAAARYTYSRTEFLLLRYAPREIAEAQVGLYHREAQKQADLRSERLHTQIQAALPPPEQHSPVFEHSLATKIGHSREPGITARDWAAAAVFAGSRRGLPNELRVPTKRAAAEWAGSRRDLLNDPRKFRKKVAGELRQIFHRNLHQEDLPSLHQALCHLQKNSMGDEALWSIAAQATLCQALQSHPDRPAQQRGPKGWTQEEAAVWARLEYISPDARELEHRTPTPTQAASFVRLLTRGAPETQAVCVNALRIACEERALSKKERNLDDLARDLIAQQAVKNSTPTPAAREAVPPRRTHQGAASIATPPTRKPEAIDKGLEKGAPGTAVADAMRTTMVLKTGPAVPVPLAAPRKRPILRNGWSDDDRRRLDPGRAPVRLHTHVNVR